MINFENYFAIIDLKFTNPPIYENAPVMGEITTGDIILRIDFYHDRKMNQPLRSYPQEFRIVPVDIHKTIEEWIYVIENVKGLEDNDTSENFTPFISVDGDPEDLGIWFTFTKEKNDLFIQIDHRTKDTILIKIEMELFLKALVTFTRRCRGEYKKLAAPKNIIENFNHLTDDLLEKIMN